MDLRFKHLLSRDISPCSLILSSTDPLFNDDLDSFVRSLTVSFCGVVTVAILFFFMYFLLDYFPVFVLVSLAFVLVLVLVCMLSSIYLSVNMQLVSRVTT